MNYRFYTKDQYPPYWFNFIDVPEEIINIFKLLKTNNIDFSIRGGFALAHILELPNYKIKDVDLFIEKREIPKLLNIKYENWSVYFNKNNTNEDILSIFKNKENKTYLKFDMKFLNTLPKDYSIYKEYKVVNPTLLLNDKLDKIVGFKERKYDQWKIDKNINDCKLLLKWFLKKDNIQLIDTLLSEKIVKIPNKFVVLLGIDYFLFIEKLKQLEDI